MADGDQEPDCVDSPCPRCGESRVDLLVWLHNDDEFMECLSCGETYRP
jgi:Zn ribbon nucleic-acid-binding protein